mmetsp:Transcript_34878/g.63508  ORF Transcript_34878/g.63508 Transcript_34878/m.63508 type:complete len:239 (+) Transcript_34878:93-809(+)
MTCMVAAGGLNASPISRRRKKSRSSRSSSKRNWQMTPGDLSIGTGRDFSALLDGRRPCCSKKSTTAFIRNSARASFSICAGLPTISRFSRCLIDFMAHTSWSDISPSSVMPLCPSSNGTRTSKCLSGLACAGSCFGDAGFVFGVIFGISRTGFGGTGLSGGKFGRGTGPHSSSSSGPASNGAGTVEGGGVSGLASSATGTESSRASTKTAVHHPKSAPAAVLARRTLCTLKGSSVSAI